MGIPEEEDNNTEVTEVDENTEDPGLNHTTWGNNTVPGNPPGPIPTNDNNTPKVGTVDDESDSEEEKSENKETIQDKGGFEFQVKPPSPAERHVWEASQRHGLRPLQQPIFEHKYPSDHYTNLMVHVFTQMNLQQGLEIFGNKGIKAYKVRNATNA